MIFNDNEIKLVAMKSFDSYGYFWNLVPNIKICDSAIGLNLNYVNVMH